MDEHNRLVEPAQQPRPGSSLPRFSTQLQKRTQQWIGLLILGILITALIAWLTFGRNNLQTNNLQYLPATIVNKVNGFTAYAIRPGSTTDFALTPNSTSYNGGILVFSLRNSVGATVAVTEQRLPTGYDTSQLPASQQFSTEYGTAYVIDSSDRTTGVVYTLNRTWIIVNAPSPIGVDAMKQLISSFTPVTNS